MTLSTYVYILDEVDPKEVFDWVNTNLLKVKDPITETFRDAEEYSWVADKSSTEMTRWNRVGQGFDAWFITHYREGAPLYVEDQYETEDFEEPYLTSPACYMSLDFDTAYGYRGVDGEGCDDLHASYIVKLHDWLAKKGVRIRWKNEFTGEIFDGIDGLMDFR